MQTKPSSGPSTHDPHQEQPHIPGEGVPVAPEQPFHDAPEPAEQALRDALAQPDEEGALYVREESVLREESNKYRRATGADKEQIISQSVDPSSHENLPFPLPREICLHVFSFLNTQNLQSAALVSRQSYALSAEIRQKDFIKKFATSHWWKFLVALADNARGEGERSFVDVLILEMGPNIRIPEGWRENNATLSAYITRRMGWFPETIEHLGFGISGYEGIQRKAQTLLQMMCLNNDRRQFNSCTHIRVCFALVEEKNKIAAFQQYNDLDRIFSCFILFEFMKGEQANNRLNFLISTPFARGLTGEGLVALECQFPGLFPELVREAIRLFQIEVKLEADQQRLRAIEKLLGRLTEADILAYINTEARGPRFTDPTLVQRQIFIEALRTNYEFLLVKMSFAVLIRVEHTINDPNKIESLLLIPHIIESQFILSRLAPHELLSLLKIIRRKEIGMVINDHPMLQTYCTVEIMEDLLKAKTDCFEVAKVFLSNKTLLDKLSDNNIVAFAEHLAYSDFEDVLNSQAMQAKLQTSPGNSLLMRLAKSNKKARLGRYILLNLPVSLLLTANQAIEVYDFTPIYFDEPLIRNKALMDKLSSSQLIHLLRYCDGKFDLNVVQDRLHKFTNKDLILLVQSKVSENTPSALGNYLLETLPLEIDRRVSSEIDTDYRLDSEALCKLSCAHQQLACYIQDHYGDRLNTDEYILIRDHYPPHSYDSNTPILIAIAKDREKRLERLERTSKATATNPSPAVTSPSAITLRKSTSFYQKTRKDPYEPKPTQIISLLTDDEWSWVYFILQLLCIIGAVFGLLLAISGIGSAAGISIITTVTQVLFASLPMSHALILGIVGLGIFIASSIGWLATDDAKQNTLTLKNKTSEVKSSHNTDDSQFKKLHGAAFNYQNNPTVKQGTTTNDKKVDSPRDDTEDEMLVDRQSCLNFK